jgi:enolase-phosphatase E1
MVALNLTPVGPRARVLLFDIEGTLSPTSFVKDVLFSYSREHLRDYVRARGSEPRVAALLREAERVSGSDDPLAALLEWQEKDEKVPALKELQGLVWEDAYTRGDFVSPFYPDALNALRGWREAGFSLFVYSSGSLRAQELFFHHNEAGDLRTLFGGFFDTTIGPKTESSSYLRIATQIGVPPDQILFFSDRTSELAAACRAGLLVVLVTKEVPPDARFPNFEDYGAVRLE